LLANHSDLDLTARNLPCCATRGTTCGYTKSQITLVAPCFVTRTALQCTAWVAHNFDDHARDFVIWVEHSCSHGPAACLVSGEVIRFHGIFDIYSTRRSQTICDLHFPTKAGESYGIPPIRLSSSSSNANGGAAGVPRRLSNTASDTAPPICDDTSPRCFCKKSRNWAKTWCWAFSILYEV
jgi:hypothetical protein